mgnify:CR=1 FL=1
MDKNTVWAIVLSTLVIIGSAFLTPLIMGDKMLPQEVVETEQVQEENNIQKENSEEIIKTEGISENNELIETEILEEEIIDFELYDESNKKVIANIKLFPTFTVPFTFLNSKGIPPNIIPIKKSIVANG